MSSPAQPRVPHIQRASLGRELRRLRVRAGLSGKELAEKIGLSQPSVSRIERGTATASLPEVMAWADATGGKAEKAALAKLTEAAVNEVIPFGDLLQGGLAAAQEQVRGQEATARTLRNFQPGIIPGLLHTPAYARAIFTLGGRALGAHDLEQAVTWRLRRQEALHEPSRLFEFILTEAALRFRPGPPDMLAAQLYHLADVASTVETVTLGVIPAGAQMYATPFPFVIYEDRTEDLPPFVFVEAPHAGLYFSSPDDVGTYRAKLEQLRRSAIFGDDALTLMRAIAHP